MENPDYRLGQLITFVKRPTTLYDQILSLSKQDGAFKKHYVKVFSERASRALE